LSRSGGDRALYFVNRRGGELYGQPVYPSVSDLPEAPELVVVATPAAAFDALLAEALALGSRAFVGIFAGLGETGDEGRRRQLDAVRRLRAAGAVLLGPNCMGLADTAAGFQGVAYLDIPAGDVGLVSQSGAMGEEFVARALEWGCGFSRYVTLGNQADLTAAEVLAGFAGHEPTRVVAMYVEDFVDGRELAAAAAAVAASGRQVVLLAPGRSEAGARAARSHTGALVSSSAAVDALCRAGGAMRAATPRELFELAMALRGRPLRSSRVVVISDGGGPGGIAADALHEAGFDVPTLSTAAVQALCEAVPGCAGVNPVDFALATIEPDAFSRAVPALAETGEVDAVLAVGQLGYWSARFPEFPQHTQAEVEAAETLATAAAERGMPVVACTVYPHAAPAARLRASGVPVYREIASGVAALAALAAVAERPSFDVPPLPPPASPLTVSPDYLAAREALAAAGLRFPQARAVTSTDEAAAAAAELGFPVVLKALGVLHKSDAGGVVLGLADEAAVAAAARDLLERLRAPGLTVEAQAPVGDGVELIVGSRRDVRFGPLLLVGMGGVYAELIRDVRTALAPVASEEAARLLEELQGAALLRGARGRPRLDVAAAAEAAAALSRFAAAHPEVTEVEVNPLLVLPSGALALDARCLVETGRRPKTTEGGA
jgi:acyl-CoA synthetase (NDP forming)